MTDMDPKLLASFDKLTEEEQQSALVDAVGEVAIRAIRNSMTEIKQLDDALGGRFDPLAGLKMVTIEFLRTYMCNLIVNSDKEATSEELELKILQEMEDFSQLVQMDDPASVRDSMRTMHAQGGNEHFGVMQ